MSDDAIFREVDEEVRAEQFQKLWKRYGPYVTGAAIGIILAVSGIKGWQYWQVKQAEDAGEQYLAAASLLKAGKTDEANEAFGNLAGSGSTGFAALAKFRVAAEQAKTGSHVKALATFDEISSSGKIDPALRNLARVRAALLAVDLESLDAVEKRISSLNTADGAWRHSAREIIAMSAYKNGDTPKADRLYNELLADIATPPGLRQRAQIMVSVITPKLSQRPRAAAKQTDGDKKQSGTTE